MGNCRPFYFKYTYFKLKSDIVVILKKNYPYGINRCRIFR